MKIAIVGAGFTGLAAAYELAKQGHSVTIFEKDGNPGGLAIGYKQYKWSWTLEYHYHHWFSNDSFALNLAKEIDHKVIIKKPHTNVYLNKRIYELDSIKAFLTFPLLTFLQRIRHLLVLGLLFKINPFWKPLEKMKATRVLPQLIGKRAFDLIWKPQLHNKMGKFMDDISLVWFWARIRKRTPHLAYPQGGFLQFALHLTQILKNKGVIVYFETEIEKIIDSKRVIVETKNPIGNKKKFTFDKVIVTLPSFLFLKITPQLPADYKNSLVKLQGLGATNLVLRLKDKFFTNNTYWLSICDTNSSIMAIIEHTNFMDKKNYNNEHIIYIGKYHPMDDQIFTKSKEEVLKLYDSFLKTINPRYKKNIIGYELFKAPFAQPIIPINYSNLLPAFKTPLPNVFLANIEQVYPWDRGTNYAIELGIKIANIISNENEKES